MEEFRPLLKSYGGMSSFHLQRMFVLVQEGTLLYVLPVVFLQDVLCLLQSLGCLRLFDSWGGLVLSIFHR